MEPESEPHFGDSALCPTAEIQVLRPLLPTADQVLPYLKRIDVTRIYSNFGPLSHELQERLARIFRMDDDSVICTNSGTSALIGAILASAGRGREPRSLAMIPALTFSATAMAVEQCGYEPYFVDVHPKSWLLDPQTLVCHPRLHEVGVVIPVAAFGRPVPQEPWRRFMHETGIPVVFDGAASFQFVSTWPEKFLGSIPVAISFHATKSFGVGEGGCVVWSDPDATQRLCKALNFGLYTSRLSVAPSSNGKMSEYHAAVGLAELDNWPVKIEQYNHVVNLYRRAAFDGSMGAKLILYPDTDFIYPLVYCEGPADSLRLKEALARQRIGSRFWYGAGMHEHPYYTNLPRDVLDVCSDLAQRLLALPMAPDLTHREVSKIYRTVAQNL